MTSSMMDAAKTFVAHGLKIAPAHFILPNGSCSCGKRCASPGKHPITKNGYKDATDELDKVTSYWEQFPNANIISPTDADNGFFVVDLDVRPEKDGIVALEHLQAIHGPLPLTVEVVTGSGGRHLYFRHPTDGDPIRNRTACPAAGIDIRGIGGYVIAPPSSHASGQQYAWRTGHALGEIEIATAPDWLLNAIRAQDARSISPPADLTELDAWRHSSQLNISDRAAWAERQLQDACAQIRSAPVGTQEETLNKCAFTMGRHVAMHAIDETVVQRDLVSAGMGMINAADRQPWRQDEIERKVVRGIKQGAVNHLAPPTKPTAAANDNQRSMFKTGSDVEIAKAAIGDLEMAWGQVVYDEGRFWRFDCTHWSPLSEHELRLMIHAFDGIKPDAGAHIRLTSGRIDSILREMAAMASHPGFFSDPAPGICCASGLIEFDRAGTPSVKAHSREHRHRHVIAGEFDGQASIEPPSGSLLEKLLNGVFQDDDDAEEKKRLFAEILGAAALGISTNLPEPKAFVFYGATAANGKSQALELVRGLLPDDALATIPADKLGNEQFLAKLAGKMLNTADELSSARGISSDTFKAVVTGDPVSAKEVYRPAFHFTPRALHVFATNHLPSFKGGLDQGVRRRLSVLQFDRTIPVDERIEHIGRKIAETEADALLRMTVGGACRLLQHRRFTVPSSSDSALREWIYQSDIVAAWMDDRLELGESVLGQKVSSHDAYTDFQFWCERQGIVAGYRPQRSTFSQRVLAAGRGVNSHRVASTRSFVNLRLRATSEIS